MNVTLRKSHLGLLLCLVMAMLFSNLSANATILTFDFDGGFSPNYGDNVSTLTFGGSGSYGAAGGFTPNVTVNYTGDIGNYGPGYGNLTNVIYENNGIMSVKLIADASHLVSLDSFALAGWPFDANEANTYVIDSVEVLNDSSFAVYSDTHVPISRTTFTGFDFGSPLVSQSLTIRFNANNLGGNRDDIGLDNVQFSQLLISEPGSFAMAALGGLILFGVRRWRRRYAVGQV